MTALVCALDRLNVPSLDVRAATVRRIEMAVCAVVPADQRRGLVFRGRLPGAGWSARVWRHSDAPPTSASSPPWHPQALRATVPWPLEPGPCHRV